MKVFQSDHTQFLLLKVNSFLSFTLHSGFITCQEILVILKSDYIHHVSKRSTVQFESPVQLDFLSSNEILK